MKHLLLALSLAQATMTVSQREPEPRVIVKRGDTPAGLCDLGDLVRAAKAYLDAEHPIEAQSPLGAISTDAAYLPCRDHSHNTPACQLQYAEQAVIKAKAVIEAEKKRAAAEATLRDLIEGCSPKEKTNERP